MGRVKQVHLFPAQIQRNVDLLANGVRASTLWHGPEVLAELLQAVGIGRLAEQHEFRRPIDSREMPQQVSDVRADPVVTKLPRVYGDAHAAEIVSTLPWKLPS